MLEDVWRPNTTVAAVIEREGRFLMVEEISNGNRVINQPAGHLEDDETFLEAVQREVLEETGHPFHAESLLGCYRWRNANNGLTFLRLAYIGYVADPLPDASIDADILDVKWMSYDEIQSFGRLRSPLVLKCLDDYLAGTRYPLTFVQEVLG
ncbi:MAG: NUDIX hydrolase [Pseudomonadota bacterium]